MFLVSTWRRYWTCSSILHHSLTSLDVSRSLNFEAVGGGERGESGERDAMRRKGSSGTLGEGGRGAARQATASRAT